MIYAIPKLAIALTRGCFGIRHGYGWVWLHTLPWRGGFGVNSLQWTEDTQSSVVEVSLREQPAVALRFHVYPRQEMRFV
jgi:hypothetical protein